MPRLLITATPHDSPEVTGHWECLDCGETDRFTGIDPHGWGGRDECDGECGYDPDSDEGPDYCTCETVLTQDFTVIRDAGGKVVDLDYSSFEGGGDGAEIGEYTTILCGECGALVWEDRYDEDREVGQALASDRMDAVEEAWA